MYCSREDIAQRFGEGKLDRWLEAGLDALALAESISSEVDGYLAAGGYTLPLSNVPVNLKGCVLDLMSYRSSVYLSVGDSDAEKAVERLADRVYSYLEGVARGKIALSCAKEAPLSSAKGENGRLMFKSRGKIGLGYGQ